MAFIPSDSFNDPDIAFRTIGQRCQCVLIVCSVMHAARSLEAVKFDDNDALRLSLLIGM